MTRQDVTFESLNGFYLTSDNTINSDSLNEDLQLMIDNNKDMYEAIYTSRRRKVAAVVWWALIETANNHIRWDGNNKYVATSAQLKKWLNDYGNGYDTIAETVKYYTEEREKMLKGEL